MWFSVLKAIHYYRSVLSLLTDSSRDFLSPISRCRQTNRKFLFVILRRCALQNRLRRTFRVGILFFPPEKVCIPKIRQRPDDSFIRRHILQSTAAQNVNKHFQIVAPISWTVGHPAALKSVKRGCKSRLRDQPRRIFASAGSPGKLGARHFCFFCCQTKEGPAASDERR